MIIDLDPKYRERYQQMEMCRRWIGGVEVDPINSAFFIMDYPIAFVKGDHASQIEKDHTSISMSEFEEFAKQCSGKVYAGTARLIFEREVVIGFDDEADAMAFKLRFQ